MQTNQPVTLSNHVLPRGRLLTIRDGRDTVIHVKRGWVWITQEGDSRDREFGPGAVFRLDRDGLAIVQAYERSAITLAVPQAEAPAGAFRRFWTSLVAPLRRPLAMH